MPSVLENAAARFRRELLNQEREAASAMVRVYGESWRRVSQRIADLQAQIEGAGPLLEPSWLFQFDRLTTLQAQIEAEIRRFAVFAADATTANQMRAIQAAGRHAAGLVDLAAGVRPTGVEVPFDVLPTAALQELVGFASDGSPLRDLFGEISGSVADGVADTFVSSIAAGYNPRVTARLLRQAFGVGLRRALTIARTETIRAYTEATHRNYLANRDVVEAWVWCSALDSRTCPACWAMHGSIHPLDERLFDHPNGRCLTPGTLVSGPRATAFVSRHYEGDIVTIRTASGKLLSVTPNHPILTDRGWVSAQFLNPGDNVVCDSRNDWATSGVSPDEYQIPTLVEDIPTALNMDMLVPMPCSPENFHGDGKGSDIYIVRANSLLRDTGNSPFAQPFNQILFGGGNIARSFLPGLGNFTAMEKRVLSASGNLLGDSDSTEMLLHRGILGQQLIGGGLIASLNPRLLQSKTDYAAGNVESLSQSIFGFSGEIGRDDIINGQEELGSDFSTNFFAPDAITFGAATKQPAGLQLIRQAIHASVKSGGGLLHTIAGNVGLDCILEVGTTVFSGQVYNLQTKEGWYIADGIITHNCSQLPQLVPWARLGYNVPDRRPKVATGAEVFATLTPNEQRQILGPVAFAAFRDGAVSLEQFATIRHSDDWGDSVQRESLTALIGPDAVRRYVQETRAN